jgi:hypothetical protein
MFGVELSGAFFFIFMVEVWRGLVVKEILSAGALVLRETRVSLEAFLAPITL